MYFPDLSEYSYWPEEQPGQPPVLNVGWLDSDHEFPQGEVPVGTVERLLRRALDQVNPTRGYHSCPLCDLAGPVTMHLDERPVPLGSAEIRVDANGKCFAAPNLIAHFIQKHHYKPPDAFLRALGERP